MSSHKTLTLPDPNELLVRLGIEDLDLILKERRLCWYGHVEHSNGAVKTAFDIQVDGKRGPGRPKMTWKQLTEKDCREWKLLAIDPHDRHTLRSGVRSAIWMLPLYLHVNQKSNDDAEWQIVNLSRDVTPSYGPLSRIPVHTIHQPTGYVCTKFQLCNPYSF